MIKIKSLVEVAIPLELAQWFARVDGHCVLSSKEVRLLELIQNAVVEAIDVVEEEE